MYFLKYSFCNKVNCSYELDGAVEGSPIISSILYVLPNWAIISSLTSSWGENQIDTNEYQLY